MTSSWPTLRKFWHIYEIKNKNKDDLNLLKCTCNISDKSVIFRPLPINISDICVIFRPLPVNISDISVIFGTTYNPVK